MTPGAAPRSAVVVGASGLVGSHALRLALESPAYAAVTAIVRRRIPFDHPKLRQAVIDFDRMEGSAEAFHCDDLYLCLGTTIGKAGSQDAFRKVDYGYTLEAARLASRAGATRALLVSSVGADARSGNFYLRTKGELEEALRALPFRETHVFRPSFLKGVRAERRPGERVGIAAFSLLAPALAGPLSRYRPVQAVQVAEAMLRYATSAAARPGFHVHEWREIAVR